MIESERAPSDAALVPAIAGAGSLQGLERETTEAQMGLGGDTPWAEKPRTATVKVLARNGRAPRRQVQKEEPPAPIIDAPGTDCVSDAHVWPSWRCARTTMMA